MATYPKSRSRVTVEFTDGEVKHYEISASPGIASYLADEMQSGALRLSDQDAGTAVLLPTVNIKSIRLQAIPPAPEPQESDQATACLDPITENKGERT